MLFEEREKEIESIKPREFKLELSDADLYRLKTLAGSVGMKMEKLLENFIGDLVDGTYSNGSDERELANQWFERCWFGMFPEKTFLRYLILEGEIESFISYHQLYEKTQKEIMELDDEEDEDYVETLKDEFRYNEAEMKMLFEDYMRYTCNPEDPIFEEAREKVLAWYAENMDK